MTHKTPPDRLHQIQDLVQQEPFLKLSILDLQDYDGTLVALTDSAVPRAFVRMLLKSVWDGEVEVYCATALMTGSNQSLV